MDGGLPHPRRAEHSQAGERALQAGPLGRLAHWLAQRLVGGCVVCLYCDGRGMVPVAFDHIKPESRAWLAWLHGRSRSPFLNACAIRIFQTGEPIWMPTVSSATLGLWTDPAFLPYLDRYAVSSLVAVPLHSGAGVKGTIAAWREEPSCPLTEANLHFLEAVGRCFAEVRVLAGR